VVTMVDASRLAKLTALVVNAPLVALALAG
jgi:hypothetical protein